MFCLFESCRGFRFARFSGENRNELSEGFFFGVVVPNKKVFPIIEEGDNWIPNGHSASCRRLSGLELLVDLGSRGVVGCPNGEAETDIVLLRHSVIMS